MREHIRFTLLPERQRDQRNPMTETEQQTLPPSLQSADAQQNFGRAIWANELQRCGLARFRDGLAARLHHQLSGPPY